MRAIQTKLYSFAAPLALLPLMDVSLQEIPDYFRGDEFRTLIGEMLIQLVTGIFVAIIAAITQGLFGVLGA